MISCKIQGNNWLGAEWWIAAPNCPLHNHQKCPCISQGPGKCKTVNHAWALEVVLDFIADSTSCWFCSLEQFATLHCGGETVQWYDHCWALELDTVSEPGRRLHPVNALRDCLNALGPCPMPHGSCNWLLPFPRQTCEVFSPWLGQAAPQYPIHPAL